MNWARFCLAREATILFLKRFRKPGKIYAQFMDFVRNNRDLSPSDWCFFEYWILHLVNGMLPVEYFYFGGVKTSFLFKYRAVTWIRMGLAVQAINKDRPIHILNDKKQFNEHFNEFLHRDWFNGEKKAVPFLRKHSKFIVKPIGDYGGNGIVILDLSTNSAQEKIDKCHELNLLSGNYICEELIEQKGILNKIHPQSVNTLRVVSLYDEDRSSAKLLSSFFRTGCDGAVTDNLKAGGILWHVDHIDGVVLWGTKKSGNYCTQHPNSDIDMSGFVIPRYHEAVSMCLEAHKKLKEVPLIGWDVVISDDFISLIEGNAGPGFHNTNPRAWSDLKEYMVEKNLSIPKVRWY